MAYEVTATKKRPKTFDQLLGQEFVVATLKNALNTQRIAHAYLFSGPRGVGKTSAARILARSLNNPNGPSANVLEDYPGSDEISRGTSLDVIEIDGASNTSVNDVRAIKDEVLFPPQSSPYKIYIIDEVHMLSNSAFNALLKTIEEPPPYIVFIFATTEIHKVPATIRSRCQQFNFRLIPLETIRDTLKATCEEMDIKAEEEALFWIAKESTGSLRDAFTLFDQVVSFSEGNITVKIIREKLGLLGLDRLNTLSEYIAKADQHGALMYAEEIIGSGVSIEQFIIDLSEYFRSILFLKSGVEKESLLGYPKDRFSKLLIDQISLTQCEKAIEILLNLYRDIRYSLNPRFDFELALSKLTHIKNHIESHDLVNRLEQLNSQLTLQNRTVTESNSDQDQKKNTETVNEIIEPDPTAAKSGNNGHENIDGKVQSTNQSNSVGITQIVEQEYIKELINVLKKSSLTLASIVDGVQSLQLINDTLHFEMETSFQVKKMKDEMQIIQSAVDQVFNPDLQISISVMEKEETEEHIDPEVEMVRQVFRGEIIEDKS